MFLKFTVSKQEKGLFLSFNSSQLSKWAKKCVSSHFKCSLCLQTNLLWKTQNFPNCPLLKPQRLADYGNHTSSSPSSLKWGSGPTICPMTVRPLLDAMAASEDRKLAETSQSTTITYTTTTSCNKKRPLKNRTTQLSNRIKIKKLWNH